MIETNGDELKDFKYIDLFCGIGGFHIALSSFGATCVFASDIDKYAQNIYKTNFKIQPHGDIKKIRCKDIPPHDILCAGFPCQPFSISGNQHGFDDKSGNGKLFFEIIRIARYHKPKLILLENVRNLEYHNGGKTLKIMKEKLNSIGYHVFYKTLNVHWFNPLAYLLCANVSEACEVSCDMAVTSNMSEREQKIYMKTILELVEERK